MIPECNDEIYRDIRFWRGTRVEELTRDELTAALTEVYRELQKVEWKAHQLRLTVDRLTNRKGKKNAPREKVDAG